MKRLVAVAAAIITAMSVIGGMDHEDATNAEAEYVSMVCAGNWPDYKGTEPDCSNGKE